MINTWDETRNHLRNPQKPKHTQNRYSHAPTDIVTIIARPMETKGHIYTSTISGNRGRVCVRNVLEVSVAMSCKDNPFFHLVQIFIWNYQSKCLQLGYKQLNKFPVNQEIKFVQ
jgi:hypothetical protein